MLLPEQINQIAFWALGGLTGGLLLLKFFHRSWQKWSALRRSRKKDDLMALTPQAFEDLVARIFESYGHHVDHIGGNSDHGVDIVVRNEHNEKWVVQCKRYRGSVGEPVLRDLYGTMLHEKAQGAYLFTSGSFTQGARRWAEEKPIFLYDGEALIKLIRTLRINK